MYSDEYFSAEGDWAGGFDWGAYESDQAEENLREEAREILSLLPEGERLLDIGCAGGVFLDEARRAGFEVRGIEFNRSMAELARSRFDLSVTCGDAADAPFGLFAEEFDTVTLLDTLEHIPRPRRVLRRIAAWTGADAVVLVRGPIHNDPLARAKELLRVGLGLRKELEGYPLDANYFTKKSLAWILALHGFRVTGWPGEVTGFAHAVARRTGDR